MTPTRPGNLELIDAGNNTDQNGHYRGLCRWQLFISRHLFYTYLKFQVSGPQLRWTWGGSAVLDSVNNVGGKERPMRACHHGQWYECKTCRGQVNNSVDPRVGPPGDVRPQPTTVPAPTHSAGGRSSHWLETCLQPSLIGSETPLQPALSPFSISEINYS